jgi:DNA-directed RNA polymerase II subunit RPB9
MDGSPGPDNKAPDSKKISFRFCREWYVKSRVAPVTSAQLTTLLYSSNMLYPKEDRLSDTLMFACRTCQFSEPATASCIWRNSLKEDVQETAGNVDDVAQDPTVGDSSTSDHVMEDLEVVRLEDEDIMPEMCTMCGHEILCPICEGPTDGALALEVDDRSSDKDEEEAIAAEKQERERSSA